MLDARQGVQARPGTVGRRIGVDDETLSWRRLHRGMRVRTRSVWRASGALEDCLDRTIGREVPDVWVDDRSDSPGSPLTTR